MFFWCFYVVFLNLACFYFCLFSCRLFCLFVFICLSSPFSSLWPFVLSLASFFFVFYLFLSFFLFCCVLSCFLLFVLPIFSCLLFYLVFCSFFCIPLCFLLFSSTVQLWQAPQKGYVQCMTSGYPPPTLRVYGMRLAPNHETQRVWGRTSEFATRLPITTKTHNLRCATGFPSLLPWTKWNKISRPIIWHLVPSVPTFDDLQTSWLLLLVCASSSCLPRTCAPTRPQKLPETHNSPWWGPAYKSCCQREASLLAEALFHGSPNMPQPLTNLPDDFWFGFGDFPHHKASGLTSI